MNDFAVAPRHRGEAIRQGQHTPAMTSSFEVDIQDLLHAFKTAEVVPFEQARGSLNGSVALKLGEYRRVEDGVIASIYDQHVLQPYYVRTIRRNHISFSFVREGDYSLQLARQVYLTKGAMARMTVATDSLTRHVPRVSEQKLAGVTIFVDAACLVDRFGLDFDKLPSEFRNPSASAAAIEFSMEIPLPPWSWVAIEQIFDCRFEGVVRSMFMRAKITTAQFYADHILVKAPGLRDSIVEGAASVTELALEAF